MLAGWDRKTPLADPMCGSATLLIEASVFVDTLIQDELTEPVESVQNDTFAPYLNELGELQSVLEAARGPATGELLPLVDELEKALAVMDTIADLLKALE